MTVIIDYGCGNPASIRNMLKKLGFPSRIVTDSDAIENAERIIFPGVGSFDFGADRLAQLGLVPALTSAVLEQAKPILGICLGAQLLCRGSEEGTLKGLGWLDADVVQFEPTLMATEDKIPHMGWSDVEVRAGHVLFENYSEPPRFYFAHSYHLKCDRQEDVVATARHGYRFTVAAVNNNIAAVQFHPEKSHVFGMKLLEHFVTRFPVIV